ncbi:G patch domain-containing protein 11-like protein [Leptotrombidium deliense]|uniref:G patch domain-containing protein 11-like protein n=1 Tax=Leptotrombidium deliense TaxID=299467 RepID=A0A443SA77_9ACAR|nr:G patch domain-containing protein 11-like protein [Leptotrombidium deliense]
MSVRVQKEESDEEELDFMSDAFVDESRVNCRPGLVFKRSTQRLYDLERKKAAIKTKSFKELQKEKREEALSQPLSSSNKGFQLLQKMGFKPEKDSAKMGKVIPVVLKEDNLGLGMESHIKERIQQQINVKRKATELITGDFQKRQRSRFSDKKIERDLCSSQKACFDLDSKSGVTEPKYAWFWPLKVNEKKEEEEAEDEDSEEIEIPSNEKLTLITAHLRSEYKYCIWCGVKYATEDELNTECPGDTSEDHDD